MSVEDVRRFYSQLAKDKELREKVAKAGERLIEQFRFMTGEELRSKGPRRNICPAQAHRSGSRLFLHVGRHREF